jgi:hypothetical protein
MVEDEICCPQGTDGKLDRAEATMRGKAVRRKWRAREPSAEATEATTVEIRACDLEPPK